MKPYSFNGLWTLREDDFVELEAVKSLLQSFGTAEEALQAAEAPKRRKKSCFEGKIQTDKIKPLIN